MGLRRVVLVGLVVLVLVLLGGAGGAWSTRQVWADDVAVLDPVQGMVQVRAFDDAPEDWVTLDAPLMVEADTLIRTGSRGLAMLVFFEGTAVEVLPNSIVIVDELDVAQVDVDGSFTITLGVLAGDTLHHVETVVDVESHYTIHTPSASIVVRGTTFWTSAYPMGETQVRVLEGTVDVAGLAPDGRLRAPVLVVAEQMMTTFPGGGMTEALPITELPQYPPEAPLAPVTCGNGTCEAAEDNGDLCPLDCEAYEDCGDGICDLSAGENAMVCPADCLTQPVIPAIPDLPYLGDPDGAPSFDPEAARLHFLWGNMTCRWEPSSTINAPLFMHWGVGCFDHMAHALAHTHPADYQLYIDGSPADMA
ncbi:MAG: FecR family protein, partial [Anaerolineae bacterium]|nr:FecR family protein [Anaerolineae bacterium]